MWLKFTYALYTTLGLPGHNSKYLCTALLGAGAENRADRLKDQAQPERLRKIFEKRPAELGGSQHVHPHPLASFDSTNNDEYYNTSLYARRYRYMEPA